MKYKLFSITIIGVLSLGGCSLVDLHPESTSFGMGDDRVTVAGANQLFSPESFEKLDLLYALDPGGKRPLPNPTEDLSDEQARRELQEAYEIFDTYPNPEYRRNRIQDRIMAASEQRCNVFKTYIKRLDSTNEIFTDSMATLLGGLGAIFTSANTARALSGSAAIFSGIGAEFEQGFFANVATHVLVPGIELKRKEIRKEIDEKRKTRDDRITNIANYTVERAIGDAIRFHGACSIDVGIAAAGEAVKEANNPGKATIERATEIMQQIDILKKETKKDQGSGRT
uniref:Lipoprotein n=1 Tax=Candidatus Kentrum sp. LFY TaxID=2126342 RepID=A0A450WZ39_9GAMM|nr:MAG: hypothetical protein BECKLFY1418A_GA0070994_11283 [Candidatus Kentron sp. LFY]VFK22288.1 MAG: hypothetical protein BECKLFY1418C_GA0070996_11149 [Candidatus Kentron sp. LFY]